MIWILGWLIYGLVVGLIAKFLHPGEDPIGWLPTLGIGVVGSYIGGFINFLVGRGGPFAPSGIAMGIVGGVIFCWAYRKWHLDRYFKMQKLEAQKKDD